MWNIFYDQCGDLALLFVSDLNGRAAPLSAHVFARARERLGCGGIVTILSSGVVVVQIYPCWLVDGS